MKFKTLTCIAAMALLTALAIPVVAQEQQNKKPPRYTIKVLGTLGGTFSEAVGINNRGSLAGSDCRIRPARRLWRSFRLWAHFPAGPM